MNDVEHLLMYLVAIYILSLEKCLFGSFAHSFVVGEEGVASLIAQLVENLPAMQETLVEFLVRKTHW